MVPDSAFVAEPPAHPTGSFDETVCAAMDAPLDKKPLKDWDFRGKKVAILVDDWGRPTPCGEFLPSVLDRISGAEDITVITSSGMHDPMGDEAMERKVGKEVVRRCRCVSHDAGDHNNLAFVGITPRGTPIWVNKYAAQADIRLCFGRIFPHSTYGYEGGYKMIVPGIASFETILRDHSFNFSDHSNYGILQDNPSRGEADAVGRMVGIDFCVNIVVDYGARPVKAFAGSPEAVFPAGVNFGERHVWGAVTGRPADITLLCGSAQGRERYLNNPDNSLGLALSVTKPDGVAIVAADYKPRERHFVDGYDLDLIPIEQLLILHEKRNWQKDSRQIQHVIKGIRGAFYERRVLEMHEQRLFLASDTYPRSVAERWKAKVFPNAAQALKAAMERVADPFVVVIPDPEHTLPLVQYDFNA